MINTLDEKLNFDTGNEQAALIVYSVFLADVFLCFCISVCFCFSVQMNRNRRLELLHRLSILEEAHALALPMTRPENSLHVSHESHHESELSGIPVSDVPHFPEDGVPSAPPITLLYSRV